MNQAIESEVLKIIEKSPKTPKEHKTPDWQKEKSNFFCCNNFFLKF
jgi:hypothetical protein